MTEYKHPLVAKHCDAVLEYLNERFSESRPVLDRLREYNQLNESSRALLGDRLIAMPLAPGYGLGVVPYRMIQINPEDAASSKFGYVFEGQNSDRYGVPEFCAWGNAYNICDDPELEARILEFVKNYSDRCQLAFLSARTTHESQPLSTDPDILERFIPAIWSMRISGIGEIPAARYPHDCHIERPAGYTPTDEELQQPQRFHFRNDY